MWYRPFADCFQATALDFMSTAVAPSAFSRNPRDFYNALSRCSASSELRLRHWPFGSDFEPYRSFSEIFDSSLCSFHFWAFSSCSHPLALPPSADCMTQLLLESFWFIELPAVYNRSGLSLRLLYLAPSFAPAFIDLVSLTFAATDPVFTTSLRQGCLLIVISVIREGLCSLLHFGPLLSLFPSQDLIALSQASICMRSVFRHYSRIWLTRSINLDLHLFGK